VAEYAADVVEKLADVDAAVHQFGSGGFDVVDHQVQAFGGSGRGRRDLRTENDGAR